MDQIEFSSRLIGDIQEVYTVTFAL